MQAVLISSLILTGVSDRIELVSESMKQSVTPTMTNDPFFPSIGHLAQQTDGLPEEPATADGDAQDDQPLEQIESLCMRCEEQVRSSIHMLSVALIPIAGNDPHDAHLHPLLW